MASRPSKVFEIPHVSAMRIHSNLSYQDYFSTYSRENDGVVKIATYSFNANAFNTIHKLMPFSTLYVAPQHKQEAEKFVNRYPFYLVYVVPGLHSKCIHFEKSNKFLIGSQNLFNPTSSFEELTCEITLPANTAAEFAKHAFAFPTAEYVGASYCANDIKIYGDKSQGNAGLPYLPCHSEVEYWRFFGESDSVDRGVMNHRIYLYLEYQTSLGIKYLAFDRHYQFCGELTKAAVSYLASSFAVRAQKDPFLAKGSELRDCAPFKDRFAMYHPVALNYQPVNANYID